MRHAVAVIGIVALLSVGCAGVSVEGPDPGAKAQAKVIEEMERAREARARADAENQLAEAPEETVDSLLADGQVQRDSGDLPAALWSYIKAHDLDREDPRPLARIASIHLHQDPERAAAIFTELVENDENAPGPRTGLGLVHVSLGEYGNAERAFRRALVADPDYPAAHNALGLVLAQRGETEEARIHFLRAADLQPRSYVPLNNLGVLHLSQRDNALAVEVLRRAVLIERRDPAVFNNLGVALGRLDRFDEALQAFRRAGPEHVALNNLAFVQRERGLVFEAIESYEKALLAAPPDDRLEILRNLDLATKERALRYPNPPASSD